MSSQPWARFGDRIARGVVDVVDDLDECREGFWGVVVTFEGPLADYRPGAEDVPERAAHLVYGASREQALHVLSAPPSARYVYVTSGTLPHPWGGVPDYFGQELAALGGCR